MTHLCVTRPQWVNVGLSNLIYCVFPCFQAALSEIHEKHFPELALQHPEVGIDSDTVSWLFHQVINQQPWYELIDYII